MKLLLAGVLALGGCAWFQQADPAAGAYVLSAEQCIARFDAADEARSCIKQARARYAPDGGVP